MKKYNLAVFIGRFAPLHNGHIAVINKGLEIANRVLVIIGSANSPYSYRNPFTAPTRGHLIREVFYQYESRIFIAYNEDTIYNDNAWIERIQTIVNDHADAHEKIALIGHEKDNSSYYLKLFPQWDNISVPNVGGINSTDIRAKYFENGTIPTDCVSPNIVKFLKYFYNTTEYQYIKDEYKFVKEYKRSWESAPYPPIFTTVDACVVQSGHILLVERKAIPGKGLLALPGGFLNQHEKIIDGTIRELREETKIKVPAPVLRGNIVTTKVFDDPHRSSRGRTITHASLIHLPGDTQLPKVKGSDDAASAKWFPLSEVRRDNMFEDHFDMIENLTALL
jgi:bifunctional NMN adenylyltransferase/nudix hydrolase